MHAVILPLQQEPQHGLQMYTGPTITTSGNPLALGCNPSAATIDGALGTATATDACGIPTVTFTNGSISSAGCGRTQTRTFTAIDACGNTSTAARTATWTADVSAPTITTSGNALALGCNPSAATIDGALGTATATDACGIPTVTFTNGSISSTACGRSQTRTFTAIDGCGNTSTALRTATWTDDPTPPIITCPAAQSFCQTAGSYTIPTATASDACLGTVSINYVKSGSTTGSGTGGNASGTYNAGITTVTFTATDACGNTATCSTTVTINPVPAACVAADHAICIGSSTTIGCPAVPGSTYSWTSSPVGFTSTAANPTVSPIVTTTYTLTETAAGCTRTNSVVVTVGAPPTISQNPTDITGCKTAGNSDVSFTATSVSGMPAPTAQWQVSADGTNYTNVVIGTTTSSTLAGVTTSQYTFTPGQSDMEKYYRVIFSNACGSVTSTGAYLFIGENITVIPGQNEFNIQIVACAEANVCVSITYTSPQNVVGWVHTLLEIAPSNSGPWSFVFEDSTLGSGNTEQVACFPVTAANNGWWLRWRIWNYGCGEYHQYQYPLIIYPKAEVTTVNSCIGGGPVTFTKTGAPPGGVWSVNGGGSINSSTGLFTPSTSAAAAGCWIATYSTAPSAECTGTKEFIVFPTVSAPIVNTGCGPIIVTPPPTVTGFNIEYSFDDGVTWGTNTPPTAENCAGYKIKTRYVTTADCGDNPAGTFSSTGCPSPATTRIIDLTPPVFIGTYITENLGCNPSSSSITAALGSATATDACGTPTITFTTGPVQTNSCGRSQVRTFTARDGCGNTVTTSRTVTWVVDVTPPTFTGSYPAIVLGCNPTSSAITAALGTASATDACGTLTITFLDGAVQTNSCGQSQVRTFTATDGCGNTATTSRTVSWTSEVTPPTFTGSYSTVVLGCNPTSSAITAALGTATATDACGAQTIIASDGAVQTNSCTQSQVRTFTATDGCGNTSTTSRTVSWTADVTPPSFTGSYTTLSLGCNPSSSAITAALSPASATDGCGTPTITSIDGPVQSSGCGRSQTRTFTARDGCNNTSTVSRTVTWIFDNTASITASGTTLNAGCNPSAAILNAALGTATSTDACSTPTITQTDGPVISTGCNRSQTRSWSLIDACGNTASASRIITWTEDTQTPTITATGTTLFICGNPNPPTIDAALGNATASDNCSTPTIIIANSSQTTVGCITTQTRTWTATDACGNTATTSRTVSWSNDNTPPVFTGSYTTTNIGCNPTGAAVGAALGLATASDGCGTPTITSFDGSITTVGCTRSQTRTFTATDACSNTSTTSRTVTWTSDVTPPVFTGTYNNTTLGCNPAVSAINTALGSATATDVCGAPTITQSDGTVSTVGCTLSQTRTFIVTDACGNTASTTRIVTWTSDVTPPTWTTAVGALNVTLQCNDAVGLTAAQTLAPVATDNCNSITYTKISGAFAGGTCGGTYTNTWTATDACNNISTVFTQVITINPAAAPTFTSPPANITVACGAIPAVSSLNYSNGLSGTCLISGSATSTQTAAPGPCGGTVTETWTATDACGRTITASRTITVTPAAAPTFTSPPANITVACGAIPAVSSLNYSNGLSGTCLISGSATSTQTAAPGPCGGTVTETWTATDACGRTITASRTITVTPAAAPTFTSPPSNITVACGAIPAVSSLNYSNGLSGTCLISGSATSTQTAAPGPCGGTVTETWTATDACGRTITASRTITVTPAAAPTFTSPPSNITVACGAIPAVSSLNYSNGLSGTCLISGSATSTQTAAPGPCGGTVTETWTATDACGRTITASRTITVTPAAAPTFTSPPSNITVACGAIPAVSSLNYSNGLSGTCLISGSATSTQTAAPGPCGGTVTETWTATDACGRTITASRIITVTPAVAPTFTSPPANITVACGGIPAVSALNYSNGLSGTCLISGSATSTQTAAPGPCGGTVTETWNATDACGRTITASRIITVTPAAAPTFTSPPANIIVACGGIPAVSALNYSNGLSGTCLISGSATSTQTAAPGPCGGTVTETWTATDACGRTITASRTITVTPAAAPTFTTPPSNITVACGAIPAVSLLNYSNGLSGTCLISGSATSTQTAAPGPCGGTVTETWTATDACGRTITASRIITVTPAVTPTFTSPPANITVACGGVPAVSSLNYSNGLSGTCLISGSSTSTQTAAPGPCGGTVTETWTATDACGRTITASRIITVTPAAAPTFTSPPANIIVACGGIPAVSALNYSNGLSGTCLISGSATSTQTAAPGPCGGTVTETWNATDACWKNDHCFKNNYCYACCYSDIYFTSC